MNKKSFLLVLMVFLLFPIKGNTRDVKILLSGERQNNGYFEVCASSTHELSVEATCDQGITMSYDACTTVSTIDYRNSYFMRSRIVKLSSYKKGEPEKGENEYQYYPIEPELLGENREVTIKIQLEEDEPSAYYEVCYCTSPELCLEGDCDLGYNIRGYNDYEDKYLVVNIPDEETFLDAQAAKGLEEPGFFKRYYTLVKRVDISGAEQETKESTFSFSFLKTSYSEPGYALYGNITGGGWDGTPYYDAIVNGLDMMTIFLNNNKVVGQRDVETCEVPTDLQRADLNNDGIINNFDFALFGPVFGSKIQ